MNVTLAPEVEEIVLRLDELRQEIAKGIDSLDRGERVPLDIESIKAGGRRKLAENSGGSNGTGFQIS